MRSKLFKDASDGAEPQVNLFEDACEQTFKYAGELVASSIVMNGPAPNIFAPWVYQFICGGTSRILQNLPDAVSEDSVMSEVYNKV